MWRYDRRNPNTAAAFADIPGGSPGHGVPFKTIFLKGTGTGLALACISAGWYINLQQVYVYRKQINHPNCAELGTAAFIQDFELLRAHVASFCDAFIPRKGLWVITIFTFQASTTTLPPKRTMATTSRSIVFIRSQ